MGATTRPVSAEGRGMTRSTDQQTAARRKGHSHVYILVYKPAGVLGDFPDPEGRPTVRDLVPVPGRLFAAGRLDARTEGLMLLTDDGKVAHRLTHPRYGFEREYLALVEGKPTLDTLLRVEKGIPMQGWIAKAQRVMIIGPADGGRTWLRVIMTEGKKREVRKLLAAVGHPVLRLIRVRFGPLHLGDLEPGQWRFLTEEEVRTLLQQTRGRARRARRGRTSR